MEKQVNGKKTEQKAGMQSLTVNKKEKVQVAQCCAKVSKITAGCHD